MTDKAYIVSNEQQEREVLEKLEREGLMWINGRKPTERMPSSSSFPEFPYVLFSRNRLSWGFIGNLSDEEIVYDGRKREKEQMSEKYVVSQEFMNELENSVAQGRFVSVGMLSDLPYIINNWRITRENKESNNRLIAIIRWVNGEEVFEVEKPKKWVVRSKEHDGQYFYGRLLLANNNTVFMGYSFANATRFDTKEEAESWANAHQEVVEVEG